jgi:hypothetical protein
MLASLKTNLKLFRKLLQNLIFAQRFFSAISGFPSLILCYWWIFLVCTSQPAFGAIFWITGGFLYAFSG